MNLKLKAALITIGIFLLISILITSMIYFPELVFTISMIAVVTFLGLNIYKNILDDLESKKQNDKRI